MSEFAIRPFADRDAWFRQRVAPRLHPGPTASPRDPAAFAAFFERFGRETDGDDGRAFVAVNGDDRPLGLLVLQRDRDAFTGHRRALVNVLVVDGEAEGRGVGQALMRFAEAWGRERDCREVCLDVFAGNDRAVEFYERNGFRVDHLRMTKPLSWSVATSAIR